MLGVPRRERCGVARTQEYTADPGHTLHRPEPYDPLARWAAVQLFHYHLVTSRVREVEARYIGKLGVRSRRAPRRASARSSPRTSPGSPGASSTRWASSSGSPSSRRAPVERRRPAGPVADAAVDHLGFVLDEDEFETDARARGAERPARPGARAAGARSSPQRRLPARAPSAARVDRRAPRAGRRAPPDRAAPQGGRSVGKAKALARDPRCRPRRSHVVVGETVVRFVRGGPLRAGRSSSASCSSSAVPLDSHARLESTGGGRRTYDAAGVSLATANAVVERLRAAVESTGATGFGQFAALHPLGDGRLPRRLDRLDRDEADRRAAARRAPQLRRRHGGALHQRRDHLRRRAARPARLRRRGAHRARAGRRARSRARRRSAARRESR